MEQKIYKIVSNDTLESIAEKTGYTAEEIMEWHNSHSYHYVTEALLPIEIILPDYPPKPKPKEIELSPEEKEKQFLENLFLGKEARYRCEQVNTSNVNGIMSNFTEQKYQYTLCQNLKECFGRVKLEEHFYKFEPKILNPAFDLLSKTEFIKNDVFFSISKENGRIEKIMNKKQINDKWQKFKETDFDKEPFIERLNKTNPNAVLELKNMGDKQFSENYELSEEEYRRSLFYFCCFDKWLYQNAGEMQREEFLYMSVLVPPIIVPIEFRYDKFSETNDILTIIKVGTLKLTPQIMEEIKKKYDEIHKPNIKYNFTEYKLLFRGTIDFNIQEKLVETASLTIREEIVDNVDSICEFKLRRLKEYTS